MNKDSHQYKISLSDSGQRLDKFLSRKLGRFTRSYITTLIKNNYVEVNNDHVKSGYNLKPDDIVKITVPEAETSRIIPENIDLDVVFEDDDLLVVNKPAGLVVHPGAGNYQGTLVNALLYHCQTLSGINGILRPGIVHRLDKNTSGLLVVAKNDRSHLNLSRQFETKTIQRTYNAIVWGVPHEKQGEINTRIGRSRQDRKKMTVLQSKGKEAVTRYKVIHDYTYLSFLELSLGTGRTHQIRVHLNYLSHPVFGDPEYNGRSSQIPRLPIHLQKRGISLLKFIPRQALHARALAFMHPANQRLMQFESHLPHDMENLIQKIPGALML